MISLGLVLIAMAARMLINVVSLTYDRSVIHSLSLIGVFYLTGLFIFSSPFILFKVEPLLELNLSLAQEMSAVLGFAIVASFLSLAVISPIIDRKFKRGDASYKLDLQSFHTFASLPVLLFVSTCSLLNFSFCFAMAALIVPIYGFSYPTNIRLLRVAQSILLVLTSPIAVLLLSASFLQTNLLTLLANIIQQQQLYGNLIFPFFALAFLPMNLAFFKLTLQKS